MKFRIRRTLQLPEGNTEQGTLFPEIEALPAVVEELLTAGLSREDALHIWQRGVEYVTAEDKPEPEVFETYIREKIHLLKRRQAVGRVTNSTGFLLDAIKKNYANPEFAEEQKQEEARKQAQERKAKAHGLKALEEQRKQAQRTHDDALHAHCQGMIAAAPGLLEEAIRALQPQHFTFRQYYRSDKTPLENYHGSPIVYIPIDTFLTQQYPGDFQALHDAHKASLATLDAQIAALQSELTP